MKTSQSVVFRRDDLLMICHVISFADKEYTCRAPDWAGHWFWKWVNLHQSKVSPPSSWMQLGGWNKMVLCSQLNLYSWLWGFIKICRYCMFASSALINRLNRQLRSRAKLGLGGFVTNTGCRSTPQLLIWPDGPPVPSLNSCHPTSLTSLLALKRLSPWMNKSKLTLHYRQSARPWHEFETIHGGSGLCHYH